MPDDISSSELSAELSSDPISSPPSSSSSSSLRLPVAFFGAVACDVLRFSGGLLRDGGSLLSLCVLLGKDAWDWDLLSCDNLVRLAGGGAVRPLLANGGAGLFLIGAALLFLATGALVFLVTGMVFLTAGVVFLVTGALVFLTDGAVALAFFTGGGGVLARFGPATTGADVHRPGAATRLAMAWW